MRKRIISLILYVSLFLSSLIFIPGCRNEKNKIYKIGFSQCTSNGLWRQTMLQEMRRAASIYDNIQLVVKDAGGKSPKQIEQIQEFIDDHVDVLIISPNESENITSVAVEAFNKGIPTILIDRNINSENYTSYVAGDNYELGYLAGQYIAQKTEGKGTILEILGTASSSIVIERQKGFSDAIEQFKMLKIEALIDGGWTEKTSFENTKHLNCLEKITVVFAHSDVMALGAQKAFGEKSKSVFFVGLNALPGKDGGVQMIIDGKLNASILYPTGGKEAIDIAHKIINKETFNKNAILPSVIIDSTNAEIIQRQNNISTGYMKDIDKQQEKIQRLNTKYYNLRVLNSIVVVVLVLLIVFIILTIRAYIKRKKIINKLNHANITLNEHSLIIEEQAEELKVQAEKLSVLNATKDRLFSILAHDLRNPFNVIIGFSDYLLEELNNLNNEEIINIIQMMQSSTSKMSDLLDNILQWSQTQSGVIEFNLQLINLYTVVEDTKLLLNGELFKKSINFKNLLDPNFNLYADLNMLSVILRNLISNAIKFTPKNGIITIDYASIEQPAVAKISISDTGVGIPENILENLFQISKTISTKGTENEAGTGLGLILCKEFIELHKGKIWVESQLSEGTTFYFTLPTNISTD